MLDNNKSEQVELEKYTYSEPYTKDEIEECVVDVRLELYHRDLPCGPKPIIHRLRELSVRPIPSERTISRILARNDLTYQRTGYYEGEDREYLNKIYTRKKWKQD